jgi:tRNA (adenine57-N1/adenine58-N1)-methyltransferase catalytic subunit
MEQVLRTVGALNAAGFSGTRVNVLITPSHLVLFAEVTMYESLIKPHDISAVPPLPSVADATARLKAQDVRKEEKRVLQIAASHTRNQRRSADGDGKRKREEAEADGTDGLIAEPGNTLDTKKVKIEARGDEPSTYNAPELPANQMSKAKDSGKGRWKSVPLGEPRLVVSKPFAEVRGHTSYLTFALLVPQPANAELPDSSNGQAMTSATTEAIEPNSESDLDQVHVGYFS